ncbi:hypothetical protein WAI453_009235 [Rhynchosporium graminicola]
MLEQRRMNCPVSWCTPPLTQRHPLSHSPTHGATRSTGNQFVARGSLSRSAPACTALCSISDSPLVKSFSGLMRFASTKRTSWSAASRFESWATSTPRRALQLSGLARSRTRPDEAKMAFDLLHKFSVAWDSLNCDPPASNDSDFISRNRAEKTLQAAFGENRAAAFGHIWALLNRPWFTRKWVIQELVKSNTPIMVAGRISLPWALLANWMNFVECCPSVKEGFMRLCPQPLEPNAKVLGMSMLRATLLTRIAVPEKQLLLHLIVKTLEFRCADFRDHVFAMVGIASDADTFDLIDYGSPIEKVCQKLAYACVSDSMNLKLLWSLVYLAPLKRRVRSWVPNIESVLADRDGSILAGSVRHTHEPLCNSRHD